MYEAKNKVEIRVDGDLKATVNPGKVDEFAAYTDYVYVRQYDSKVKDVVIVKGPNNVRTKVTNTSADAEKFTVTFDANGGTNAPAAQTIEKGKTAAKPADPTAPAGKDFKGWATTKDAAAADYDFTKAVTENITLYAVYADKATAPTTEVKDAAATDEIVTDVVDVVED